MFIYLAVPIFSAYLMNVIPEAHCAH